MMPSKFLPMMASSLDSTIRGEALRKFLAALRSEMSTNIFSAPTTSPAASRSSDERP